MNTVIKINGLDVEFSEKVPTRAGAYWRVYAAPAVRAARLIEVRPRWQDGTLTPFLGEKDLGRINIKGYLWSTSPLVPAVEIRHAWMEARELNPDEPEYARWDWDESRAKRVTEGGE